MIPERPGYLATRRPEGFTFSSAGILSDLGLLWQYLAEGDTRGAMFESRRLLRESSSGEPEHEAGLLAGSAEAEMRAGNPEEAERLARQSLSVFPDQWMAHGITTIRDPSCGNGLDWVLDQKQKSQQNLITAPRIYAYTAFGQGAKQPITTPEQAIEWVRENAKKGSDGIKFFRSCSTGDGRCLARK